MKYVHIPTGTPVESAVELPGTLYRKAGDVESPAEPKKQPAKRTAAKKRQ